MIDILYKLPIKAPVADVYRAISQQDQINHWWTRDVKFSPLVGAIAEFGFGRAGMRMEIETLEPQSKMVWKAISGPPHWSDTRVLFELEQVDSSAVLGFSHIGFKESVRNEVASTNTRWGFYLISLKSYLENGKGTPNPDDAAFWS
jgi:uncharacterized protein YndB with AHSA1/START domain